MAFSPDGADFFVLPVPCLFTNVVILADDAATWTDDLFLQLRIMIDTIDAEGVLRITPAAMVRTCAMGKAVLAEIAGIELGSTPDATASVVMQSPDDI